MATSRARQAEQPPAEEPQEQVVAPAWPEAPRMWTEQELLRGALREHWGPEDTEEVSDNG